MLKIQNLSQLNLVTDADILDLLRLRFEQLGFCILTNLFDDVSFPVPDFVPSCEAFEDHGTFYEMLFILSDGDDAIEIFILKIGVDPLL